MRTKVSSITLLAGILSILVLRGTDAQSATIYVPDNYATIQEAVGAANGGDTIIVRVGTHIIASKLTVPEQINLTFAPGVVVKFGGGCWLRVYGDLIAEGTSDALIVFTSIKDDFYGGDTNDDEDATDPAKNDWGNILFWDTSDGSILDHVVVKYGGQTYSFPMWQSLPAIHVFTSNLVVSNSTITENGDYGIYVVDASPTIIENVITNNSKSGIRLLNASPQITGNTITGAGQNGIIAANSNPIIENNVIGDNAGWAIALDPSSSGARIQGNDIFGPNAGILVLAGYLEANLTWNSDSVYVIDYYRDQYRKHLTVNEGATLTIEPDVVVKFEGAAKLFVKGDLIAEGTSEAQIVFTSLKDDSHGGDTNGDGSLTAPGKNDWGNIVLWNTSQQSVLAHTVVMYAGRSWSFPLYQSLPAIHVLTQIFEIKDSFISENGVDGIYASPAVQSNIVIEGNIISKNGRDGIRLYNASARVVGNTLAENQYGISLKYSPGSEVYLNNFVDNYRHALSTDSVCFWNSDRRSYTYNGNAYTNYLGNYWDDYTGTDANGDGIGDTPYNINSDQDGYPLMMTFENYEIGGEEPPEMPVKGIDVSSYQRDIDDWSEVYNAGYRFAFVKASEGEGWTGDSAARDDYFEANMRNARSAGILVGAYHLGLPQYNSPSEEASWFLEVASEDMERGDLRPVFDLEDHEPTGTSPSSLWGQSLTTWILTWMNIVEESMGVEPILYTTLSYANDVLVPDIRPFGKSITDYDLWIAYPTCESVGEPAKGIWDDWAFWQYWQPRVCGDNSVPGINGSVDLDLFNGNMSTLNTFTIPAWEWEPHFWIVFRLLSPADIVVTDPDGLVISKQLNEITEAVFLEYDINADGELDEIIDIFKRKIGDYQITVVPKTTASLEDTYCLKITTYGDTVVLAEDVAIKDIPTQPYIIRSTEDGIIPIIPATIDFDPDTLNLKSEGKWITVYIELPVGHGYDVSDINLARTFLEGLLEVQHSDVQDGVLMVKFDRQDLIIFLESVVGVIPPDDVPLTVIGELKDGRRFEGSDTVRVMKKGKNKK